VEWQPGDPTGIRVRVQGQRPGPGARHLQYNDGASFFDYQKAPTRVQLWWLRRIYRAVVDDGIDPLVAHREFMKVDEWRKRWPTPQLGVAGAAKRARDEADRALIADMTETQRRIDMQRELLGDEEYERQQVAALIEKQRLRDLHEELFSD
jgi:hypothetical protein